MKQAGKAWGVMALCVTVLGLVLTAFAQTGVDAPVAYWNFENVDRVCSNLVVSSLYHDASVLFGQPAVGLVEEASPVVSNALVLDGTSAIRLPYHQDNLGRSFTIALWYWQQTNDTRQCIFQSRDNFTMSSESTDAARDSFACHVGQDQAGAVKTGLKTWIHIAHTFTTVGDNTTLTVYSNGVQQLTKTVGAGTMFDTLGVRGIHVGAYRSATTAANGRCFKGMIDELALWGRALSAVEVQAVYARGTEGLPLVFTPKAVPTVTLAPGQLAFNVRTDAGIPDGVLYNGWLRYNSALSPGGVRETSGAAEEAVGSIMPDSAGHAEGPFNAEKLAPMRWRVPMAPGSALKRLPQDDFTLEVWFRTTFTGAKVLFGTFPGTGAGTVNLQLEANKGAMLYWRSIHTDTTAERVQVTPPGNLTGRDGNWHHLAGVRSETNAYLYMDGVLIGSNTWTKGTFDLGSEYLYIGQDGRNNWGLFDDNDEIGTARVWARALSPAEVAGLATNCLPGAGVVARDGLLAEYAAYHPFDAVAVQNGWRVPFTPQLRQITQTNYTYEVMFRTTDPGRGILIGNYDGNMPSISNFELFTGDAFRLVSAKIGTDSVVATSGAVPGTRDGNWHRAAVVRRDGKIYLYMDGLQRGTAATETLGPYVLRGPYLGIGRDFRTPALPLNGDIGAVHIWNRALTAEEIAGLSASNSVPASGLIAQYGTSFTNTLQTAGFPGTYFLRSMSSGVNSMMLTFTGLPRHKRIDLGMILAQLDSLNPATENDRFVIKLDGEEILRVALGPGHGGQPQIHLFNLFGDTADVQIFKDTLLMGGDDFFCGGEDTLFNDHVYDLSQLQALQSIPHTADTLVLELVAMQTHGGENEGFGVDDIQLTVYPPEGTLISLR